MADQQPPSTDIQIPPVLQLPNMLPPPPEFNYEAIGYGKITEKKLTCTICYRPGHQHYNCPNRKSI